MSELVATVRQEENEELKDTIHRTLEMIKFCTTKREVKRVVIKPNLCYYWRASTGYTSDPKVTGAVIDCLREEYGEDILIRVAESDATAMKTHYAFRVLGYDKLAEMKNVELFNLSSDSLKEETVRVGRSDIKLSIPNILRSSDLFINVPKMKVMRATKMTCALKNMFGCIGKPRKIVYHPKLEEAIVAINKVLKPDLTIVDGLVALGRYPAKLDTIIAGSSPFSVDWVTAMIMGFNPNRIKVLKTAKKEGLGNPANVTVVGEKLSNLRKAFPRVGYFFTRSWDFQLSLLNMYSRIVGDIVPPILQKS